ncbi:MAG: hypothetical protein Tsb002_25390 [Wenzhouxiangellaceae bacterium]
MPEALYEQLSLSNKIPKATDHSVVAIDMASLSCGMLMPVAVANDAGVLLAMNRANRQMLLHCRFALSSAD